MKRNIKLIMIVLSLILSAGILSACGTRVQSTSEPVLPTITADTAVIVEGNLVPTDYQSVPFTLSGRVDEILVEEGDSVQKGDVLMRLGNRETYQAVVTAAELELENAQQALDDLNETADIASSKAWLDMMDAKEALIAAETHWDEFNDSNFADDLDEAELDVIDAQDDLDTAREDFDQHKSLDADNPIRTRYEDALEVAEQDYTDAVRARDLLLIERDREQALLDQAQSLYDEAQRNYEARLNGTDPDTLALAEARLENAQAQLDAAQIAFENLDVTAAMDGTVVELNVTEGEQVMPGQNALLLADFSSWYVDTSDLTELEVVKIFDGQEAVLVPDALPDLELSGHVDSIADVFEERLGDITYKVRIKLDEPDPRLRWGMTVEVTFIEEMN
jgi:multidrug efflux pump subunit AcrA (membrane-fusion protein)